VETAGILEVCHAPVVHGYGKDHPVDFQQKLCNIRNTTSHYDFRRPLGRWSIVTQRRSKGSTVKSLVKALELFKLFTPAKDEWSVNEMVDTLGYHKSSVQRLVTTLQQEGFLERAHPTLSRFRLGPMILMLGNVMSQGTDLQRVARPYLERLADQTEETSHLCVVDRSQCYYLDKIDSKQAVSISTYVGQRLHLHCSAVGKALLSGMSVEEVDRIIEERGLPRFTDNTITHREKLLIELERIRKAGLSFDNEEYRAGLRCMAAPVRDSGGGVVAAVSISGPIQRLTQAVLTGHRIHVKEAAWEISAKLGYVPHEASGESPSG
jgi:IclR family transcriptional regulator, KDG regulon repressor